MATKNKPNPIALARANRLIDLRKMTGLSREKLSARCKGVSSAALRYWEEAMGEGLSEKGANKLVKGINYLGISCSLGWLLEGDGPKPCYLKDLDYQAASKLVTTSSTSTNPIDVERQCFLQHNPGAVTLRITDDGMLPVYQLNDIVGGILRSNNLLHQLIGLDCIVETPQALVVCRRLIAGSKPKRYTLSCINPNTHATVLYNVPIIHAASIIWIRRKF